MGIPDSMVRSNIAKLTWGGVLEECNENIFRVMPVQLRFNITKDVFFTHPPMMNWRDVLPCIDIEQAALTITGAYAVGARISTNDLHNIVELANSIESWKYFARVDNKHVPIILEKHQDIIPKILGALLESNPKPVERIVITSL